MRHRHTKSCKHGGRKHGGRKHSTGRKHSGTRKHTKKIGGLRRKHHHTKNCKHTKRNGMMMMKGGISSYPSSYSLGVKQPVSNFDFTAASYGSNVIPTSQPPAFPFGANSMSPIPNMSGGRRTRRLRKYRGGGYSFLPPNSELTAKDSYLANVAPYSLYNE